MPTSTTVRRVRIHPNSGFCGFYTSRDASSLQTAAEDNKSVPLDQLIMCDRVQRLQLPDDRFQRLPCSTVRSRPRDALRITYELRNSGDRDFPPLVCENTSRTHPAAHQFLRQLQPAQNLILFSKQTNEDSKLNVDRSNQHCSLEHASYFSYNAERQPHCFYWAGQHGEGMYGISCLQKRDMHHPAQNAAE
jgi:hypothetical protein